ncbi:MAG TPA: HEAT repeat domain-containing protein, partial [Planctomycetota bacterium]|nr:HEAT repeat domain-containing protein [Planctomycetota bacterium]
LRMAVAQLRLYPPDSPQVAKVAGMVHGVLANFLATEKELALAGSPEGLLINGKRHPPADAAAATLEAFGLQVLQESRLRSLRFGAGIEERELMTVLHALAQKCWDLPDAAAINRRFREEGVAHVSVDEVEYVAVGKSDVVLKDAAGLDLGEVVQTLEGKIERAADQGAGGDVRLRILRQLLEQDPGLLARLNGEEMPAALASDAHGALSFAALRQALGDFARGWAVCPEEARGSLRRASDVLLEAFKGHTGLRSTLRSMVEKEAPALMPDWLKAVGGDEGDPPAVVRAWAVLGLPPATRAEALAREGPPLVRELLALERTDLAEKLFDVLFGLLADDAAQRRRWGVEALVAMKDVLDVPALASLRSTLESRVQERLDRERDPAAYAGLCDLAASLSDSRLRRGEVNDALRLIDVLKRHSILKDAAFPERGRLVLPALDRLTSGQGYKAVAGALKTSTAASAQLQDAIDRAALQFLVGQMKGIESTAERLRVGDAILKAGETAGEILAEELRRTKVPSEALRLLEVLPGLVSPGLAASTLALLLGEHPVLSVRRRAATLLGEKNCPNALEALAEAFRTEKDPVSRAMLAEALGRLRSEGVDEILRGALAARDTADEVKIACAIALGRRGDKSGLPVLVELALPPSRLRGLFHVVPPAVRATAVRGLALFSSERTALETLNRLEEDADPVVRSAARAAIAPMAAAAMRKPPEAAVDTAP